MAISYFIRSNKSSEEEATIWLRFRNRSIDIAVKTPFKTPVYAWDSKHWQLHLEGSYCRPERELSAEQVTRFKEINEYLKSLKTFLENGCIADYKFEISSKVISTEIDKFVESKVSTKKAISMDILEYCEKFIKDAKSGSRPKDNGLPYDEHTIKAWKTFYSLLDGFLKKWKNEISKDGTDLRWDTISKKSADAFRQYMVDGGYLRSTTNKNIACFRALVRYALEDGIHSNAGALESFHRLAEQDNDAAVLVYLNEDELQALFDMELTGKEADARDVFLVGCYTGQRVSDYNHLTPDCFGYSRKTKMPIITLTQEKTSTEVVIPVVNDNLKAILERHNYRLPYVCDQVLNRYIKTILARLAETVPSLKDEYVTTLTMKERNAAEEGKKTYRIKEEGKDDNRKNIKAIKYKWEAVSSHVARRSFITNLYASGKFSNEQLMSLSGHKSEEMLLHYVRLSSQEMADKVAERMKEYEDEKKKAKKSNRNLF